VVATLTAGDVLFFNLHKLPPHMLDFLVLDAVALALHMGQLGQKIPAIRRTVGKQWLSHRS
jgi:hypothetical protein